ncbi:MAG: hypothetical protein E7Z97_07230 [Propionibacteriaceae bacterium]|nr:hypothetical protein [Propionibacteriaceae bacterium]
MNKFEYTEALRGRAMTGGEYRLLTTLLTYADFDCTGARPSVQKLAKDTCSASRRVQRTLAGLVEKGYLERHETPGRPSAWTFHLPVENSGSPG